MKWSSSSASTSRSERLRCALPGLLLLLLAAGCGTPCQRARTDTVALPVTPGEYYLFHAGGAEWRRENAGPQRVEGFGPPTAGALNVVEARSGVACGSQVAFLEMRAGSKLQPVAPAHRPGFKVDAMTIRGPYAALVSTGTGTVRVVRVPSGEMVWEGKPGFDIGCLHYAIPDGETGVVLVGQGPHGVIAQRWNRAQGAGTVTGTYSQPAMDRVQACATAGEDVLIVGLREESTPPSGMDRVGRFRQSLSVLKMVPDPFGFQELVLEQSNERAIDVVQAVAGERFFAVVLALPGGQYQVRVYDITQYSSRTLWKQTFVEPVSVAWLNAIEFGLFSPGHQPVVHAVSGVPGR